MFDKKECGFTTCYNSIGEDKVVYVKTGYGDIAITICEAHWTAFRGVG